MSLKSHWVVCGSLHTDAKRFDNNFAHVKTTKCKTYSEIIEHFAHG